ncbi:hypothetical protein [Shiella aurantiaca]|nr:hypothetical protein [Shiella aurantiaca]
MRINQYLILFLLGIFASFNAYANTENLERRANLILPLIKEYNEKNDSRGESHRNIYLIDLVDADIEFIVDLYEGQEVDDRLKDILFTDASKQSLNDELATFYKLYETPLYVILYYSWFDCSGNISEEEFKAALKTVCEKIYVKNQLGGPLGRGVSIISSGLASCQQADMWELSHHFTATWGKAYAGNIPFSSSLTNSNINEALPSYVFSVESTIGTVLGFEGMDEECLKAYFDNINSPLFQSHVLREAIRANPCILLKLHAIGEGLGRESPFMEDLKQIYLAAMGLAFSPPLAALLLPAIVDAAGTQVSNEGIKAVTNASLAAIMDAAIQGAFYHWFEQEEGGSWSEAMEYVDYYSVTASAFESGVQSLVGNSRLAEALIAAGSSCLLDGISEQGTFRDEFSTRACLKAAMIQLIIDGTLNSGKIYEKIKAFATRHPDRMISRFMALLQSNGMGSLVTVSNLTQYLSPFGISENQIRQVMENVNTWVEIWYTSSRARYQGLKNQFNNLGEALLVSSSYGTAYIVRLLKNNTPFAQLSQPEHLAGLNGQLAARNIGTSLSQSDYEQLLDAYAYVQSSVGDGLGNSAPDIFDFLSTHLHVQDIKSLATKGIDPLRFKTTLEELLIEGAENRHLTQVLRELPDSRSFEEFSEKLLSLAPDSRRLFYTDLGTPAFAEAIKGDVGLVDSWSVVKDGPELLRRNPENLEKLSKFIKETGMEESKLISSFGNTKNPQKWIDMKIPEADLDNIYNGFKNDPPFDLDPWTPQHKAERWAQYKLEKGSDGLDYKSWSNVYDGNIDKAISATRGVDDYFSSLGWGKKEVTISDFADGSKRRLDIADEARSKGVEFKEYSGGKVYASEMIRKEVELDGILVNDRFWEMEWIFKNCEPSAPLRKLLDDAGISVKLVTE